MLIVKYKSNSAELQYSLDIILKEFLGLDYQFQKEPVETIEISQINNKKKLTLNADFFNLIEKHWLSPKSMPVMPLKQWQVEDDLQAVNLLESSIPVIYGKSGFKQVDENHWHLGLDVFGSSFFMLSRYEEAITLERDNHDRFPATASIAYEAKFLDRPIVDEYTEVLWQCIHSIWPELKRRKRTPETIVSCDVDNPYSKSIKYFSALPKEVAIALIKYKSIKLAFMLGVNTILSRFSNYKFDPYDTFDWIMEMNRLAGNSVTFYFMVDNTAGMTDGYYSLNESRVQALMKHIYESGHYIGLHGSYNTYNNAKQLNLEAKKLRTVMAELEIHQESMSCRQHYLRWNTPKTAVILDEAKFNYDSSLGYADHSGFRCGTCHEFTMYDLINRNSLNIKQQPLIVMESSIISKRYMNLGYTRDSLFMFKQYKEICYKYGGNFTLLWHNSHLNTRDDKFFYSILIKK